VTRRAFISLLGGAAAAWPLAAHAQQAAMPVVGILGSGSPSAFAALLGAFRQGLKETGYIEGQNVAIESRWAEGQFDRLSDLAADLVRRPVALIVATGVSSALAAKAASSTIPLVFLSQDDPVKLGLVTSFNQPDGNATGMSLLTGALVAKRLEFIRQLMPENAPISYLMNPQAPESEFHLSYMQVAARDIGQRFMASIGGAGTFDGIFLTAILAVLIAGLSPVPRASESQTGRATQRYAPPTNDKGT
jgi:putative tryptophan/tyrosine transport system substrate-binding protein